MVDQMNPGTGVEGARVCTRLLRRDQGSLPLLSLGSGQRRGGRSIPGDGGASCRSGLGSEKGSSPVCFSGHAEWGCGALPAQGQDRDHALPRHSLGPARGQMTHPPPQLGSHTWTLGGVGVDAHPADSLQRDGTWIS